MTSLVLRGYAAPFASPAYVELGIRETIAPGAFDFAPWDARLLFGDHDGRPIARRGDGSLTLFQDAYGLGFEAHLDEDRTGLSCFNVIARGSIDGCSVNFVRMTCEEKTVGDTLHRRVTKARIDHIALLNRPAYATTGVWPASIPANELPPHLQRLAKHWHVGWQAAALNKASPGRPVSPSPSASARQRMGTSFPSAHPLPLPLRARLSARRAELLPMLDSAARYGVPQIFGHAALGRLSS